MYLTSSMIHKLFSWIVQCIVHQKSLVSMLEVKCHCYFTSSNVLLLYFSIHL